MADVMYATGCKRTEAARQALTAEPDGGNTLDSSIARLVRKFRETGAEELLRAAKRRAAEAAGVPLRIRNATREQRRVHAQAQAAIFAIGKKMDRRFSEDMQTFYLALHRHGIDPNSLTREELLEYELEILKGPRE